MSNVTKIAAIVNKNWETEGVVSAMVSVGLRPSGLPFPAKYHVPAYDARPSTEPRLVFEFKNGSETVLEVTLWCIQDMMFLGLEPDPATQNGSSSEEKYRVLPDVLKEYDPDLIISVSTAGYPGDFGANGAVVIGGNFFVHNGNDHNELSRLKHKDFGKLLANNVNSKVFSLISNDFKNKVEPKFLRTPRDPAEHPCCIASKVFTAVSVVNVTDYSEYNWADHEALAAFKKAESKLPCASSETTHGVVKLCTDKPVVFMSPITDQFGHFDFQVTPTQNFAASFNGGVVLGQLLCELAGYVKDGGKFGK